MATKNENTVTYSVADLCGVLGISRVTAYELVHQRGFPVVKIGRRLLIPKEALRNWIEKQTVTE